VLALKNHAARAGYFRLNLERIDGMARAPREWTFENGSRCSGG